MPFDPETGERMSLPPIPLEPSIEGHNMVVAEVPMEVNGLRWTQYQPVCSCGFMPQPWGGRYYTRRGANGVANRHLRQETHKMLAATGLVGHQGTMEGPKVGVLPWE